MKTSFLLTFFCLASLFPAFAQETLPEDQLDKLALKGHMYFLASDFLQGRRTGSQGNLIAANYLAAQLEAYGLKPLAEDGNSYLQPVPFESVTPPQSGSLTFGEETFAHQEDLLLLTGPAVNAEAKIVFAGHGWVDEATDHDDYQGLNVKGAIVLTLPGPPDDKSPQAIFDAQSKKVELASERGAIALIEMYRLPYPWAAVKGYLGSENIRLRDPERPVAEIAYGWLNVKQDAPAMKALLEKKKSKGSIQSSGVTRSTLQSYNVAGLIEGTDPDLKDQHILVTAHYDHVGVGKQGGGFYSEQDSIFNGARDNAFGTISALAAAKSLSELRPKRSVIILAVTGEEIGLLGSEYYTDHPLVPLEKTIYNLNTDGAGYNTTEAISILGAGRTGIDAEITDATGAYGLGVIEDPAPEQGLFDRSDNVSFAKKGVPAVTFSAGLTEFDEEIGKYYHQVTDNPNTIDYDYLLAYCQSFSRLARLLANKAELPFWVEGDKYESAGKELYGRARK